MLDISIGIADAADADTAALIFSAIAGVLRARNSKPGETRRRRAAITPATPAGTADDAAGLAAAYNRIAQASGAATVGPSAGENEAEPDTEVEAESPPPTYDPTEREAAETAPEPTAPAAVADEAAKQAERAEAVDRAALMARVRQHCQERGALYVRGLLERHKIKVVSELDNAALQALLDDKAAGASVA